MTVGPYANRPLAEIPTPQLRWLVGCGGRYLPARLRDALAAELERRPAEPEPRPVRFCTRPGCEDAGVVINWATDRTGRGLLRATCSHCGRWTDTPPAVPPYTDEADANEELSLRGPEDEDYGPEDDYGPDDYEPGRNG
jgi:hypothetical protein